MDDLITVKNLTKKYGDFTAVDDMSFSVEKGEVFGILGPNGAGKTTIIEMIEGLRRPDKGCIEISGIDALKEPGRVKEIIGVQLQATSIYDDIHVKEAIGLFGSYYKKAIAVSQILEDISLTEKSDCRVNSLSGGQKQRLCVGLALVNDPKVLFLDEPTTGLDPQARHNIWSIVQNLRERGKTIILTTHYMEEAEQLCGRVAIIDRGRIIALDTPDNLISSTGPDTTIEFSTSRDLNGMSEKIPELQRVNHGSVNKYFINTRTVVTTLRDLTNLCHDSDIELENISLRKKTLEDVFLAMTGRKLRE